LSASSITSAFARLDCRRPRRFASVYLPVTEVQTRDPGALCYGTPKRHEDRATFTPHASRLKQSLVLAGERFLCVTDVADWSVVSQELSLDDEERWRTVEKKDDRLVVTDASGATVTLRFASD
jgi:hypothetical protein